MASAVAAGWSGIAAQRADARLIHASALHRARDFLSEHFVADLHAHPALKTHYFDKDLGDSHPAPAGTYPFTLRSDLPSLAAGNVNALFSALYVPEPGVAEDAPFYSGFGHLFPAIRRMKRTFEHPPERIAEESLSNIEAAISRHPDRVAVARSAKEMDEIVRTGKLAVVHTLEGGHALGRGPVESRLKVLRALHGRGVCLATLAHFYDVGVAPNIQGVPKTWYLKASCSFRDQYASESNAEGLPDIGRAVVDEMHSLGMLVDMTHMTPQARNDTVEHSAGRGPLVMTHVGCHDQVALRMNPDANEIRRIADTGGVIGVIFLNYFLKGKQRGKGIDAIVENMACMINHGGADCVAWGSDFDGFTNPPNDLREPSDMPRLVDKMLARFGEPVTAKILGENVRRVVREGWRGPEG